MAEELRIERGAGGEVILRLPSEERFLLRRLASELRSQLEAAPDDPELRRLSPPAYEDEEDQAAYRDLTAHELLGGRLQALDVLAETVDSNRLSGERADAWLRALNDLRLVLGTRLEVGEQTLLEDLHPDDPRAPDLVVYAYLSWLQEQLVEALASDPPA